MLGNISSQHALNSMIGSAGSELITDTAVHEGEFHAIQIITDATFNALTDGSRTGNTLTSGTVFQAGLTIFGNITRVQLSQGAVIAYKR